MHDQPKYRPLRPIDQFGSIKDGRSARPTVEGTVARGQLRDDVEFYTGRTTGAVAAPQSLAQQTGQAAAAPAQTFEGFVTAIPMPINEEDLNRGQELFNVYCSVCHGASGYGNGMIVRRGFRRPPSFHDERLRQAPVGYFFDVETNGFGVMPDYAAQIAPEDRWRIIAYIRALQLSQNASIDDVPADQRDKLSNPARQAETSGAHR